MTLENVKTVVKVTQRDW